MLDPDPEMYSGSAMARSYGSCDSHMPRADVPPQKWEYLRIRINVILMANFKVKFPSAKMFTKVSEKQINIANHVSTSEYRYGTDSS
jgi:hypothetical protein